MIDKDIYHVTIFCDRYGGLYSGSKWVALHCNPFISVIWEIMHENFSR